MINAFTNKLKFSELNFKIWPALWMLISIYTVSAQKSDIATSSIHEEKTVSSSMKENESDPTPLAATFVEMGKPTGGYNVITDMVSFNGRLYLTTSSNPLNNYGTNVFYTTSGSSFTNVLQDANSQGFIRIDKFDNKLWIPDGDPDGYDPGYVYISSTGDAGSFTKTTIVGAVHSFQVTKFNNKMYVANGMLSGSGGLCKYNGTTQWNSVSEPSNSFRLKYSIEFKGKLMATNDGTTSSDTDYFLWSSDPESSSPTPVNAVTGSSFTFRLFASSMGKLFWTVYFNGKMNCLSSVDGTTWTPVSGLDGKFVSDYTELNGKMYALTTSGLHESTDHTTFTLIANAPANNFALVPVSGGGYNADAMASMEAYNGAIWCGSSINGKVYKVDIGTTIGELPINTLKMSLYPNPASNMATIEFSKPVAQAVLVITNVLGEEVKTVRGIDGAGITFNCEELPVGVYAVHLWSDNLVVGSTKMTIVK